MDRLAVEAVFQRQMLGIVDVALDEAERDRGALRQRQRELYLMAPVLTAKEAQAIGMVTKVVPDAGIETAAHEPAMPTAQGPSTPPGFTKGNDNSASTWPL